MLSTSQAEPVALLLSNWSARRSGGGITVRGNDDQGRERSFTGVVQIYANGGKPFFVAKNGERVALVTA